MTKTATINRPAIALLCGTLALAMGYGIGELALASDVLGSRAGADSTILAERAANAREIKLALSKPLPRPEPLPPISSKLAKPEPVKVAARERSRVPASWSKVNSKSPEEIDAMVKALTRFGPSDDADGPVSSYADEDAAPRRVGYSRSRYSAP
ncbi:MAG: hypothetical protein WCG92_24575 [Hyphomicrobiales bacterium]|nr:hypothetical protein [Alphaproteobacteria bacterium]